MLNTATRSAEPEEYSDAQSLEELSDLEFLSTIWQTPWRMLAIGGRLRSLDVLDLIAANGTEQRLNWCELRELLDAADTTAELLQHDVPHLVCAVLLACVLDPSEDNFNRAGRIIRLVLAESRLSTWLATEALRLAAQIATMIGSAELFEELAKYPSLHRDVVWAGHADFLRPQTNTEWRSQHAPSTPTETFRRWWTNFNQPFTKCELEPFSLQPAAIESPEAVFAAVEAPEVAAASLALEEQELVTIIVPTYCPDEGFLNTINSLTRQSWRNIEVLIVDDCSPSGHEFLEAAEHSDPRVRVISQEVNGGAYRARNRGLNEARGDFVTFQDADDLSHPRRIERQVIPLRRSSLIASMSHSQRVLSDGTLTYFGYFTHRVNASSLLFKRAPVLEQLGAFDDVRKGADSEFTERLLSAFGKDSLIKLAEPLSLVQLTFGSLSRSDFFPFWMSGNRRSYLRQFRAAHRAIANQASPNWKISEDRPSICRSAPRMRGSSPASHIPAAVVSDWGINIEAYRNTAGRIEEFLPSQQNTVGLLNGIQARFRTAGGADVRREITERVESGELTWMNWADETHVGTLVFESPEYVWALPRKNDNGITADRVMIVLDETLRHAPQHALPPILWCERQVTEHFGVRPQWLVGNPHVYSYLKRKGCDVELLAAQAATRLTPESSRATERSGAKLVIGVPLPSQAEGAKWNAHELVTHLPEPHVADTVFFDPSNNFSDHLAAKEFESFGRIEQDREAFLRQIDVLLPDLLGQRLIGADHWLRDCAPHGVVPMLPYGIDTLQPVTVTRYAMLGSREFLSAMAVDPDLTQHLLEAASVKPAKTATTDSAAIRFLILGTDVEALERTRASIQRVAGLSSPPDIVTAAHRTVGELLHDEIFTKLSADGRICIVDAGTEFEPSSFERLARDSSEDVHVFTEASSEDELSSEISLESSIVATEEAPLWIGLTPILLRADLLATIARKYPRASTKGFIYAAAVSLVGGFGVLGGTRAQRDHVNNAAESSEIGAASWHFDFVRDWAELLSVSKSTERTHLYLQRVFLRLLSVRNELTLSESPMGQLDSSDWKTYCSQLAQALHQVDDRFIWPEDSITQPSPTHTQWQLFLLRTKYGNEFHPKQLSDGQGPATTFKDFTLERPSETAVVIESIVAQDDVLVVRGYYPLAFAYENSRLTIHFAGNTYDLSDQKSDAANTGHDNSWPTCQRFAAQIPFAESRGEMTFRFGPTPQESTSLPIAFPSTDSRLSHAPNSYFAIPGQAILTAGPRTIEVRPYSRHKHLITELRRQVTLRRSADPAQKPEVTT